MENEYFAEIGWNFIGDIELAKSMVLAAADANATVAKFQLWNPETLRDGPWDHDGRLEIYKKAALSDENLADMKVFVEQSGLKFMCSVFELVSLARYAEFETESVKIPSHECTNFALIDAALDRFSDVVLSIGALTEQELQEVIQRYAKNQSLRVMHCLSTYPAISAKLNLRKIEFLQKFFPTVGYSSHFQGVEDSPVAAALGASFFEKHFTTDNSLPGRDNKFALLPDQFKEMVRLTEQASTMMSWHGLGVQDSESSVFNEMRGRWGGERRG